MCRDFVDAARVASIQPFLHACTIAAIPISCTGLLTKNEI